MFGSIYDCAKLINVPLEILVVPILSCDEKINHGMNKYHFRNAVETTVVLLRGGLETQQFNSMYLTPGIGGDSASGFANGMSQY